MTHPNQTHCNTCCRPTTAPYRSWCDGAIVQGCIDAAHDGALVMGSADYQWHYRVMAVAWRAVQVKRLAELTMGVR